MIDLEKIACREEDGAVNVVVESPRGSVVKMKYDARVHAFRFHRALPLGLAYPYDWGFVPGTRAADGDPLDAMVLFEAPTWPGVIIASRPIGLLRLVQRKEGREVHNDRILLTPRGEERHQDVRELAPKLREELESFFVTVAKKSNDGVKVEGWEGPESAARCIDDAAQALTGKSAI